METLSFTRPRPANRHVDANRALAAPVFAMSWSKPLPLTCSTFCFNRMSTAVYAAHDVIQAAKLIQASVPEMTSRSG